MEAAPPPSDPVFFPPVQWATEDGLLMVGGHLTPDWLLEAYSRGIFPWPVPFQGEMVLAWFCPDPRAVLELDSLHISRRLRRRMGSGRYRVTHRRGFSRRGGRVRRAARDRRGHLDHCRNGGGLPAAP